MYYELSSENFEVLCSLKLGDNPILSTLYTDSPQYTISPYLEGKIFIVNSDNCNVVQKFEAAMFKVHHAAATPDLSFLAYSGDKKEIGIIELPSKRHFFLSQSSASHYFWFLKKTPHLLSAGGNGCVYRWNYKTATLIDSIPMHKDEVYCISTDISEERIITTSKDMHVSIWSINEKKIIESKRFLNDTPVVAMFRPGNTEEYAVCFTNGKVVVINTKKGNAKVITAHIGKMVSLHYDPKGKYIVTGGFDGFVRLWDANTLKKINEIRIK